MSAELIVRLQDARKMIQDQFEQLGKDALLVRSDVSKAALVRGKQKLEAEIDELDHCIARIKEIQSGAVAPTDMDDGLLRLKPGQYKGIPKLVSAVQSYLSHCEPPGRPVQITWLVDQLNTGGFKVLMSRSQTPTQRRPVDPRDIRVMAANDIAAAGTRQQSDGFVQGHTFRMNKKDDTIGLVIRESEPAVSAQKEPAGKRTAENAALPVAVIH